MATWFAGTAADEPGLWKVPGLCDWRFQCCLAGAVETGLADATPWLTHREGNELELTAAGWYTVVVSTSIFQLLLGLGLWKWLMWTFFAVSILSSTRLG